MHLRHLTTSSTGTLTGCRLVLTFAAMYTVTICKQITSPSTSAVSHRILQLTSSTWPTLLERDLSATWEWDTVPPANSILVHICVLPHQASSMIGHTPRHLFKRSLRASMFQYLYCPRCEACGWGFSLMRRSNERKDPAFTKISQVVLVNLALLGTRSAEAVFCFRCSRCMG